MTTTKKMLGRLDILGIKDIVIENVSVPQWGGNVCVRSMTGSERDSWDFIMHAAQTRCKKEGKDFRVENMRAQLLAMTLCDEEGNRIMTETDIVELGKKNASVLDALADVAKRLNGLSKEDDKVADARKN